MARKLAGTFGLVSEDRFLQELTASDEPPEDRFAKTFRAKANLQNLWPAVGFFTNERLAGAICWTVSKREPKVANLQLLHTFAWARRQGVATRLCLHFLAEVYHSGAKYFRVSSEPPARVFYESLGVRFQGRQKSGSFLSVGRLVGALMFEECEYGLGDRIIQAAVYKKGKGGCVEVFGA